jgi:hypothetical protein
MYFYQWFYFIAYPSITSKQSEENESFVQFSSRYLESKEDMIGLLCFADVSEFTQSGEGT